MGMNGDSPDCQTAYMHDYDGALTDIVIAGRSADVHGRFFLDRLTPGMSLLDCGCGPGSITAGFARAMAPGSVVGLDLEESQVDRARRLAEADGLTNVTFETANVLDLPFEDNRFDAVFSHAMLEHLPDPVPAVREMHRVLKPGGFIGLRSIDLEVTLIEPISDDLARAYDIWMKYRRHCGGDPALGRRLRAVLRAAGCSRTVGGASCETWATPERAQAIKTAFMEEFAGDPITRTAIDQGWASADQMAAGGRALATWAEHPDAFMSIVWCEAIGWKE